MPHSVIDAPAGGGTVPLLPEYVEEINDDEVVFRNYAGERYVYKQPKQAAATGCGTGGEEAPGVVPIEVAKAVKKGTVSKRRTSAAS